jgi:hypothetical protein
LRLQLDHPGSEKMQVQVYGPLEQVWLETFERLLIILAFAAGSTLIFCSFLFLLDAAYKRRAARKAQSLIRGPLRDLRAIEARSANNEYSRAALAKRKPVAYGETPFAIRGDSIARGDGGPGQYMN